MPRRSPAPRRGARAQAPGARAAAGPGAGRRAARQARRSPCGPGQGVPGRSGARREDGKARRLFHDRPSAARGVRRPRRRTLLAAASSPPRRRNQEKPATTNSTARAAQTATEKKVSVSRALPGRRAARSTRLSPASRSQPGNTASTTQSSGIPPEARKGNQHSADAPPSQAGVPPPKRPRPTGPRGAPRAALPASVIATAATRAARRTSAFSRGSYSARRHFPNDGGPSSRLSWRKTAELVRSAGRYATRHDLSPARTRNQPSIPSSHGSDRGSPGSSREDRWE